MPTIALAGNFRNGLTFHGDSIVEKRVFDAFKAIQPAEMPSTVGTGKKYFNWARSGHTSRWALNTYNNSDQYAMTRNHVVMIGANDVGMGWSFATLRNNVRQLVQTMLDQKLHTVSSASTDGNLVFTTSATSADFKVLICGLARMNHAQSGSPSIERWGDMNHALFTAYNDLAPAYGARVGWLAVGDLVAQSSADFIGHPNAAAATTYATAIRNKCVSMGMAIS